MSETQNKTDTTPRNPIRRWTKGVTSERRLKTLRRMMAERSARLFTKGNRERGLLERLIFT